MKTCKCGSSLGDKDLFCGNCGRRRPRDQRPYWILGGAFLSFLLILGLISLSVQPNQKENKKASYTPGDGTYDMGAQMRDEERARGELAPQPTAMTPAQARAAQKAMLDTAEVYRKTVAFTQEAEAENLSGICASISDVKASAHQALSSVRRVPMGESTQRMIETLRSGLLDIQSGAQSIQSACESGVPVKDEPMTKIVRGMRAINAFTAGFSRR